MTFSAKSKAFLMVDLTSFLTTLLEFDFWIAISLKWAGQLITIVKNIPYACSEPTSIIAIHTEIT